MTVGAFDAKTRFSELLDRVEGGEEILITRHGEPVAKMVPIKPRAGEAERREAMHRWMNAPNRPRLDGLTIRELREEGRH